MSNIALKVFWSNEPMPLNRKIDRAAINVPFGVLITHPTCLIKSVNGKVGDVVLNAADVGADAAGSAEAVQQNLNTEVDTLNSQLDSLLTDLNNLSGTVETKASAASVLQALSTKADLINGVIPAAQLPSFVDDVLEYENWNQFPMVGEAGKIYVDTTENKTWRWSGSTYVVMGGGGVALGETAATAYRGDRGKAAYDHSLSQGNPHNATTSNISEGNKLYFTEDRVRQTLLTGLITSDNSAVIQTDVILAAIGKLQAQIDAQKVTWVKANTVGAVHPSIFVANDFIELARFNGMLWIRGFFKNTNHIIYESQPALLRINGPAYKILQRISSTLIMFRITALSPANLSTTIGFYAGLCIDASSASTSSQYFSILNTTLNPPSDFYYIPPTCLGELVIK